MVIIPIPVLEELDKLKAYQDETGKNARTFLRTIDNIIKNSKEEIDKGIKVENDVILKIETNISMNDDLGSPLYGDNRILSYMLHATKTNRDTKVILVSKDIGLRVRARSYGVLSEDYIKDTYSLNDMPTNLKYIDLSDDEVTNYYMNNSLSISDEDINKLQLKSNNFVSLRDSTGANISHARFLSDTKKLKPLNKIKSLFGISAKNLEQQFAIDLLLDNDVKLVTIYGLSGGGKTLITLASGLYNLMERSDHKYEKLMIMKPIVSVGKDIGALPGPQPLDAKILTPSGWVNMGGLKIGDSVITRSGTPSTILNIFPKGTKAIYKITTNDGSSTECCEDHLWFTQTWEEAKRHKPGKVRSTKEIMSSLTTNKQKLNHYLPRNEPIQFNKTQLPLAPYTLGVLLGDGSITEAMSIINTDRELLDRVNQEIMLVNCHLNNSSDSSIQYYIVNNTEAFNKKTARPVKVTNLITNEVNIFPSIGSIPRPVNIKRGSFDDICRNNKVIDNIKYEFGEITQRWQNPVKEIMHQLKLLGTVCDTKFIPDIYKYATIEDRIQLLRGLMDTDGTIKENGEASYTTTSKQLALDIIELVKSLGGRAVLRSRDRRGNVSPGKINNRTIRTKLISYEFNVSLPKNINPFFISKKADKHKCSYIFKPRIQSIEYVGNKEAQCILIEDPEHLYITDNFIVTHNTKEEKLNPYLASYYDNINFLMKNSKQSKGNKNNAMDPYLSLMIENGSIEIEAISYLRGRSLPNTFIIIDEIQNLSMHEIKTILTRVGENSKIVLLGDESQIDNMSLSAGSNALSTVISKFSNYPIAGSVLLSKGERSVLATLSAEIL